MAGILRGDIWLVKLDPTADHELNKTRPAVIIQNDTGNMYSPMTIVAPLTSQVREKRYPIEVFLNEENSGLEKPSRIVLNQLRSIDKLRLVKKLGHLSKDKIEELDEALKISLALN